MGRAEQSLHERRSALVARFVGDAAELCGGNPHHVVGMCLMAALSPLSSMHRGNAESVAMNLEAVARDIAENIRDGTIALGRSPH